MTTDDDDDNDDDNDDDDDNGRTRTDTDRHGRRRRRTTDDDGRATDDKGGAVDWVSWFEDGDCLGLEVRGKRGGWEQWFWGIRSNRLAEGGRFGGGKKVTSQTKYGRGRGHRMQHT